MKLKYINLELNHWCPQNCWYCYLEDIRKSQEVFDRWDDLRNFLKNAPLEDITHVNLATGELSYFPDLVRKAVREIRKVEREKDVRFQFSYITNGDNADTTLRLLEDNIIQMRGTSMSYDGNFSHDIHHNIDGLYKLAPYVNCISTALTIYTMKNIEETLDDVMKAKPNAWEYYFLLDNPDYMNTTFINLFKSHFLPAVYNAAKNGLRVENFIHYENTKDNPMNTKPMWCVYGDSSLYIRNNGKIVPCGAYSLNRYHDSEITKQCISGPSIDDDIETINQFIYNTRRHICAAHNCEFDGCKATQCVECGMIANRRPQGIHQQCVLRQIEHKFFSERIK